MPSKVRFKKNQKLDRPQQYSILWIQTLLLGGLVPLDTPNISLADPRGVLGTIPAFRSHSFIFMQFLPKSFQIIGFCRWELLDPPLHICYCPLDETSSSCL